jgi:hypothetical protein
MRLLALTLVLANLLYFAWGNGLLRALGFAPAQQSEPQRLGQQIKPEALRLLTPQEARRAEQQAQAELAPKECLQTGPFDETQMIAVGKTLAGTLPGGSWQWDTQLVAPRWIVYMGKYPNQDVLQKKRSELAILNLKIEALTNASLEPGFSLGAFETKALADGALQRFNARGVRTAHVALEREGGKVFQLKLPLADEALKTKLGGLKAMLGSRTLHHCS